MEYRRHNRLSYSQSIKALLSCKQCHDEVSWLFCGAVERRRELPGLIPHQSRKSPEMIRSLRTRSEPIGQSADLGRHPFRTNPKPQPFSVILVCSPAFLHSISSLGTTHPPQPHLRKLNTTMAPKAAAKTSDAQASLDYLLLLISKSEFKPNFHAVLAAANISNANNAYATSGLS
jgi:hypothetical protein